MSFFLNRSFTIVKVGGTVAYWGGGGGNLDSVTFWVLVVILAAFFVIGAFSIVWDIACR